MRLKIPEVFSFIDNPDRTLNVIRSFRALLELPKVRHIELDYSNCKQLDLCASVVLDVLALKAKRQRKLRNHKLTFGGRWSKIPELDLMLASSGILKHLNHEISRSIPAELMCRLQFSGLHQGKPSSPGETSEIEVAASELADFFDRCLAAEGHQLRRPWKANLIQLLTEVLDNAEEHGNISKRWYTIGYFSKLSDDPDEGGECNIVIFNLGDSIYESLNRADTSTHLKNQIRALADEHNMRGLFVHLSEENKIQSFGEEWLWEEESLWTLYALQEGVSRWNNHPGQPDRGNGTVKMIEFFAELASEKPRMALVSGRTQVLFDRRHNLRPVQVGTETRKIIAFNDANDLSQRPDPEYVRSLYGAFPGTLISLKFRLKASDLAKVKEKVHADPRSANSD